MNAELLRFTDRNPDKITNDDIRRFLFNYVTVKERKASTIKLHINALKFYYGIILNREFIYSFFRPKQDKKIPNVLNKEEVSLLIQKTISPVKIDGHILPSELPRQFSARH
jgi:integrase/recombinase XerD